MALPALHQAVLGGIFKYVQQLAVTVTLFRRLMANHLKNQSQKIPM
jgi:hypothetical protein